MITSRRRFFGLMAAPAIIGISGKMQLWVPKPTLIIGPVGQCIEDNFTTDVMIYKATERWIVGYDFQWRCVYGTPGG